MLPLPPTKKINFKPFSVICVNPVSSANGDNYEKGKIYTAKIIDSDGKWCAVSPLDYIFAVNTKHTKYIKYKTEPTVPFLYDHFDDLSTSRKRKLEKLISNLKDQSK